MMKLLVNNVIEQMGLSSTQLVGTLLDGAARHTPEGTDFSHARARRRPRRRPRARRAVRRLRRGPAHRVSRRGARRRPGRAARRRRRRWPSSTGRPLIAHAIDALRAARRRGRRRRQARHARCPTTSASTVWHDDEPGFHPRHGIVTALRRAARRCSSLAVDLPRAPPALHALARRVGADLRRPGRDRLQPLCALLRRRRARDARGRAGRRAADAHRRAPAPGRRRRARSVAAQRQHARGPAERPSRRSRTSCARLHEAGLVDPVLELLAPHGVADDLLEVVVGRAGAQRRAQVGLADAEQAGAQLAVGGQADAVAVAAERLGDRVDEPDAARRRRRSGRRGRWRAARAARPRAGTRRRSPRGSPRR